MTAHTPVATALRLKTTSYFLCTLVSHLSVKDQAFCRNPVVVGFWWRGVPATSFAPVLTTALYVIPLCRELFGSRVALGSNVAVKGSSGKYLITAAIFVVVLPSLRRSLKVWPFMEVANPATHRGS
jgi:hypothetical protein